MAVEVWKGHHQEEVAVTDAGVKVAIPDGNRAFVCSIDNEGAEKVRAVLNTEFADVVSGDGVTIRADKAYTFVSRVETQPITFVTLYCGAGLTAVVNVSFS